MAPVNGGTGGGQGGRGPGQQQAQRGTGQGGEPPPLRAGTSTRASTRARRPRQGSAKAQVPAQSQGPAELPGPAAPERPRASAPAQPPEAAPAPPGDAPAAASAEPDLILTVGGTLTPAVPDDTAPDGSAPDGSAPPTARPGASWPAVPPAPEHDLLARWARDYASGRPGQQITILYAGCVTATCDLGASRLQAEGFDISAGMIDDDQPVTRAAVAASPELTRCILGDLRTVPLPPRCYDLVLSSYVLDRVSNAELVLDRLTAAIKPGGLLFLLIRDRDSAAAFLDRVLPETARRLLWRTRRAGQPGPHPAIYEPLSSARGVHAYAQLRGLVVAEWHPLPGLAGGHAGGPPGLLAAQHAVSWLSRGRLTAAHEDVLYILRKPEDRFARVL